MQQEIKYFTVPTIRGLEKIEQYYRTNKVIKLTHMGLGGGNGYTAPDPTAIVVPNEWVKLALERSPKSGFIGGGLTIENSIDEFKGKIIENVGIYDEDSELILIAAYRPIVIDPEDSIISAYTINIRALLSNAEHVTVITDTSITHPSIDDMNAAIGDLHEELSKYATTEKSGLIELATDEEVLIGKDTLRAVTPATLKPISDACNQFATSEASRVKEEIFGGVPEATLDTIKEVSDALLDTGDAIAVMFDKIAKLEQKSTQLNSTMRKVEGKLGRVRLYMKNDIDDDYLAIRGQTLRKADYPDYFAHLGITSDTLRLPDWSQNGYIRQFSDALHAGSTLEQEILSHSHNATIGNAGGHTPVAYPIDLGVKTGSFSLDKRFWTNTTGSHTHEGRTAGSGEHSHSIPAKSNEGGAAGYVAATNDGGLVNINTNSGGHHYHGLEISSAGGHNHYVDVDFGTIQVQVSIGSFTPRFYPIEHHSHVAHVAATGGNENRPKTTIAVYAVKVKYLTSIN